MAKSNRARLIRSFQQRNAGSKPGLPPPVTEDSALFNPLVHGNRKMGRRNLGPTRPRRKGRRGLPGYQIKV